MRFKKGDSMEVLDVELAKVKTPEERYNLGVQYFQESMGMSEEGAKFQIKLWIGE